MSKLGRYSANRLKVEAIASASEKTVEVSDCGTIFSVSPAAATYLNLPTVAAAGKGWWIRVVKATAAGGGLITIHSGGGSSAAPTDGEDVFHGSGRLGDAASIGLASTDGTAADSLDIAAAAHEGAYIEIWCDGTYMFFNGQSVVDLGLVVD
jgi:hypothetical protein